MIEITKKVTISDLASVRKHSSIDTYDFQADSWEECFAAVAMWASEHDFTLIGIDRWVAYDGDEKPYCVYLSVEGVQRKGNND